MSIKSTGYSYDTISNTLTMTAAFAKAASVLNTPEYRIVKQLRADNPGLTIQKRTGSGKAVKHISYEAMVSYMKVCRNSEKHLKTFDTIKTLSKGQPMPYKYVLTWFEKNFPNYSEQPEIDDEGFIIEKGAEAQPQTLHVATADELTKAA